MLIFSLDLSGGGGYIAVLLFCPLADIQIIIGGLSERLGHSGVENRY